ncbi:hypothetical protein LCGC14_1042400 [marine sediment metagenome]|uniref:Uncharacterized protein n=1 Tax=marine sediment metagenome TaxID=412755 RepID=A0A0F9MVU1_9ZZZZ
MPNPHNPDNNCPICGKAECGTWHKEYESRLQKEYERYMSIYGHGYCPYERRCN